jgi:hypothetical protein
MLEIKAVPQIVSEDGSDVTNLPKVLLDSDYVCIQSDATRWREICSYYLTTLSMLNGGRWVPGKSICACFSDEISMNGDFNDETERKVMRVWLAHYFSPRLSETELIAILDHLQTQGQAK